MGIRNEHKGRLMTIEEAIQALKKEKRTALHENKGAFDMAIKALEQEPILDKLRAEISEYGSIWIAYAITGKSDEDIEQLVSDVLSQAKKQVLDVIDKYRGESEDT